MKQISVIVIGAGARGNVYGDYALLHPEELKVIGVAEPDVQRREKYMQLHNIPEKNCFKSWENLLALPRMADAAVISTMDRMHYAPCIAAIEKGYNILLEKPISYNPNECLSIQRAAQEKGVILEICHVLRYAPFFSTIKSLVNSGTIGNIQAYEQTEHVGYWHYAHSYVRGNWRRSEDTAPMLLAKCCHDIDLISWIVGGKCTSVSSVGSLDYFTEKNAPKDAPARCLDGCPHSESCPYYAPKTYLTENIDWPTNTISVDLSMEARKKALREGPYGRCVYHCDNDVVDKQMVQMQFDNHAVATLSMLAFTPNVTRTVRIAGTKGIIEGDLRNTWLDLQIFGEKEIQRIPIDMEDTNGYGHAGGDGVMLHDFALLNQNAGEGRTSVSESMASHFICFAAEESRKSGQVIRMDEFMKQYE